MRISRNVRNVAIVLAVAVVVAVVPGAGWGATFVIELISLAFLGSFVWIASRLYREHRVTLFSLGTRLRAILYAAVGVATLTFTASPRLLSSGGGTVAFLLLLAACAIAVFRVYRSTRTY